ncbi:hypothetical protein COHA_010681, partial [Chlorella ohadii]
PTDPQVREGLLPSTYRTQLCDTYLEGRECPKRAACSRAHSLEELRVEAGIAAGVLPVGFKTLLCQTYVMNRFCPMGRACTMAHGVHEVRVLDSIRAGCVTPAYKTQRCSMHTMHGFCPQGLLCIYAHDYSELRREASVQQGNLNPKYKTTLCQAFAANGRQERSRRARTGMRGACLCVCTAVIRGICMHGDWCAFAHGVEDLRLHAAIRDHVLPATFRTRLCPDKLAKGTCPRGYSCHFAHSQEDKLPQLITKGTLCAVFKVRAGLGCECYLF